MWICECIDSRSRWREDRSKVAAVYPTLTGHTQAARARYLWATSARYVHVCLLQSGSLTAASVLYITWNECGNRWSKHLFMLAENSCWTTWDCMDMFDSISLTKHVSPVTPQGISYKSQPSGHPTHANGKYLTAAKTTIAHSVNINSFAQWFHSAVWGAVGRFFVYSAPVQSRCCNKSAH